MKREIVIHKKNQIKLANLKPGEIATSNDGRIFTRIWVPNEKSLQELTIELTDLSSQYFNHININTMVRILDQPGEGITIINKEEEKK